MAAPIPVGINDGEERHTAIFSQQKGFKIELAVCDAIKPKIIEQARSVMTISNPEALHIIFGTGPLGMAVMRELVSRGRRVRMINTRGLADVPSGVQVVQGDAYSADATTELTRGAAVVYQCAMPPYTQWLPKFSVLQAAILEGTARNGAKLIIGDNLCMYGEVNGRIHEGLPYTAQTPPAGANGGKRPGGSSPWQGARSAGARLGFLRPGRVGVCPRQAGHT